LELLKIGGKLSYSTCSLNPIENESVVAAVLKEFKGSVELVVADTDLKKSGFKFRKGIKEWEVLFDNP
jgi:16S rRNA C967 or C1407 C5-methylase (RsmB/RsmF family)